MLLFSRKFSDCFVCITNHKNIFAKFLLLYFYFYAKQNCDAVWHYLHDESYVENLQNLQRDLDRRTLTSYGENYDEIN